MSVRKFLSHLTVMPYSETPPKPASTRRSSSVSMSRTSRTASGTRRPPSPVNSEFSGYLQAVNADDAEAFVQKKLRERVARGAEADDEDVLAVVGERKGALGVQRIPAREQRVDFKAVRQAEDVRQYPGLGLRDVDRLLLLEDARLHAVVTDALARARTHRVVNTDDGERGNRVAVALEDVHLGNLLVERAAGELDAERILFERAVTLAQALRAGVLVALVAVEAVVNLVQNFARPVALVREFEPVAPTQVLVESAHKLRQFRVGALQLHEVLVVERVRESETDPALHALAGFVTERVCRRPSLQQSQRRADERAVLVNDGRTVVIGHGCVTAASAA